MGGRFKFRVGVGFGTGIVEVESVVRGGRACLRVGFLLLGIIESIGFMFIM